MEGFDLFTAVGLLINGVMVGAVCQLVVPAARRVSNGTMIGVAVAGILVGGFIGVVLDLPGLWAWAVANVLAISATMIGVEQAKQRGLL